MASSRTTTITLRVSHRLLDRIEREAERYGQSRNNYILGWLPLREAPSADHYSARRGTPKDGTGGNGHRSTC
jgi:hypothetical protein